ncbi:MAG: hypothetical protein AAF747_09760 [Planctomycetota bacterium]
MWDTRLIAEQALAGLLQAEEDAVREQSPHGIDALDELGLHDPLARGLAAGGRAVLREVHYPSQTQSKRAGRKRAGKTERDRCDLVLLPEGAASLADPVEILTDADERDATLFAESKVEAIAGCEPSDAFWLEVKAIGQYAYVEGVPGPNRSYTSLWAGCLRDLKKLAADDLLAGAGVAIVHFAAERAIAEHDFTQFAHRCLDADVGIDTPQTAFGAIADRIGNTSVAVALFSLRQSERWRP